LFFKNKSAYNPLLKTAPVYVLPSSLHFAGQVGLRRASWGACLRVAAPANAGRLSARPLKAAQIFMIKKL